MKTLVLGNWKLHPTTSKQAVTLASEIKKASKGLTAELAIAPTFVHLQVVQDKLTKNSAVALAAQDISTQPLGPFTGEVSAKQLKDIGVKYVIIGHSERRAAGESNDEVNAKIRAALAAKINPVVCIGESERNQHGDFFNHIEAQIKSLSSGFNANEIKKINIAYEPIWAIGTGDAATAEDVREMQLFILSVLTKLYDKNTASKVRLLYGGSVKPHNAKELHQEGGMNGFLVGGASLKVKDFAAIARATAE